MDTIAVFRSRSEALKVFTAIKKRRIACSTISTPSALRLGCGISIVFAGTFKDVVSEIIKHERAVSFVGFYEK